MESNPINYYAVFGLSQDADEEMIKKVFLEKARLLVEAYQVLTDKESRQQYDVGLQFHHLKTDGKTSSDPLVFTPLHNPAAASDALRRLVVSLDGRTLLPKEKMNKRLLSRIPVERDMALRLADKTWRDGKFRDLSGSGARILVAANLAVNDVIEISIDRQALPFVLAQVVRVVKEKQEFGVKWLKIFEDELPKGFFSSRVF